MAPTAGASRRVVKKKRVARADGTAEAHASAADAPDGRPVAQRRQRKGSAGKAKPHAEKEKREPVQEEEEGAEVENDVPEMGAQASSDDDHDGKAAGGDDDSYSSDDEVGQLVRTGDVPLAWYRDEDHAGYDVEGNKIVKKTKDALAKLISKFDDPKEMMTVYEKLTGEGKVLTLEDVQTLLNIQKNKYPAPGYDPHDEGFGHFIDWKQNPFDKGTPSKSRFTPSKHEAQIIAKLVRKLQRLEKYPRPERPDPNQEHDLWQDEEIDEQVAKRREWHIGPPKVPPPSSLESYNPPLEYLPTEEEKKEVMEAAPIDRPDFLAQKYDSLRHVPFYRNALRERYQRCLDLFQFTRAKKQKLNIKPDSLLPDLPRPEELRPYPQRLGFTYEGHTAPVRSLSVSHNGQYLATGCDDHFARIYEVNTGRLVAKWNLRAPVSAVGWCPNPEVNILAMSADKVLSFAVPKSCACEARNFKSVEVLRAGLEAAKKRKEQDPVAAQQAAGAIVSMMNDAESDDEEGKANERVLGELDKGVEEEDAAEKELVEWLDTEAGEARYGVVVKAVHHFRIKTFAWHHKGDYIATLCPRDMKKRQIILMQLSLRSSISPFRRFKEPVVAVSFHPNQPYFLVATTCHVRIYNLVQSVVFKKLRGTVESIASIDVHPDGDHVLAGSHDSPTMWWDLDRSDRPWKKLTSQKVAVNTARFHPHTQTYPLFATGGNGGQIHVFHGMVYDDYTKDPRLVPLKIIKAHRVVGSTGVLHLAFHPTLPWLFSAAADGKVKCWTE